MAIIFSLHFIRGVNSSNPMSFSEEIEVLYYGYVLAGILRLGGEGGG
jgi:hypothetical protein